MEKSKLISTVLLWELSRYFDALIENRDIYDKFIDDSGISELKKLDITNPETLLRIESISLALGCKLEDYVASIKPFTKTDNYSALPSLISQVHLKETDIHQTSFFKLRHLSEGVQFSEQRMLNRQELIKHLELMSNELSWFKQKNIFNINTLLGIVQRYSYCLPILGFPAKMSLASVSQMTAAILTCWLSQEETRTIPPDRKEECYSLIYGDISGIQNYIYGISTSKGVAKGLKGRSFEISLLSESIINYLLYRYSLNQSNVLLNSGGSFLLLTPVDTFHEIEEVQAVLNRSIYSQYKGDIYIALSAVPSSGMDLQQDRFSLKWETLHEKCNKQKTHKFKTLMEDDFDELFLPQGIGQQIITCDMCNCEFSGDIPITIIDSETDDERHLCDKCQTLENAGRNLPKSSILLEAINAHYSGKDKKLRALRPLAFEAINIDYFLINSEDIDNFSGEILNYYLFSISEFSNTATNRIYPNIKNSSIRHFHYGGNNLPRNPDGNISEYDDLAERSNGIKRLAVLRMDVDNLGQLLLSNPEEDNEDKLLTDIHSPAVMMDLSFLIDYFFTQQISDIRNTPEFSDTISVVYSGGDDLFVTGSWDKTVDFALRVKNAFQQYVRNSKITLSGGITLVPGKFPIHKAATYTGKALTAAKNLEPEHKDAFTFLEKPLRWEDFILSASIFSSLCSAIEPNIDPNTPTKPLNKGILSRLNQIYALYAENKLSKKHLARETSADMSTYLEALRYDKWRWILTYLLYRFKGNHPNYELLIDNIQNALINNVWDGLTSRRNSSRDIIDFIDIPTRWVELLLRNRVDD